MTRVLLIASFLYLFASIVAATAQSQTLVPEADVRFQRPFVQGVVAYNQKRHADAIRHLKAALAHYPEETNALAYLFHAAQELKDYATVIEAGELLRKHGRASSGMLYLLAKAYREVNQEDEARRLFQDIAGRPNDPYLDAAEFALAETGLNYRPRGFRAYLSLGYEHDDNIFPQPAAAGAASSNVKADRLASTLSAEYSKRFGERFFAGADILHFAHSYRREEARPFRYELLRGAAYAGVVGAGWDARLTYEHDTADLGGRDYLKANRWTLGAGRRMASNYMLILRGVASRDDFADDLLDARRSELHWVNRLFLAHVKEGAYAELGYQAVRNDTRREDSIAAYRSGVFQLSAVLPLPWTLSADAGIAYEKRRFDVPNPTRRDDRITIYSLALVKHWDRKLSSRIFYRRLDNVSTVPNFEYHQDVYGLSATYVF